MQLVDHRPGAEVVGREDRLARHLGDLQAGVGNIADVTDQTPCWLRFVEHLGLALDGTFADGIPGATPS